MVMVCETMHELKTWPFYFEKVLRGEKMYELRRNDRNFAVSNFLLLREWHQEGKEYTGRALLMRVTDVLSAVPEFGLKQGYCILSMVRVAETVWKK
jgi:hypothetical protein